MVGGCDAVQDMHMALVAMSRSQDRTQDGRKRERFSKRDACNREKRIAQMRCEEAGELVRTINRLRVEAVLSKRRLKTVVMSVKVTASYHLLTS